MLKKSIGAVKEKSQNTILNLFWVWHVLVRIEYRKPTYKSCRSLMGAVVPVSDICRCHNGANLQGSTLVKYRREHWLDMTEVFTARFHAVSSHGQPFV